MRSLARRSSSIAMTAAGMVALAVSPAQAAPGDWVVTQGGVKTFSNVGNVIIKNVTSGAVVSCTNSKMTANFVNKSNATTTVANATALSYSTPANPNSNCTAPFPTHPSISAQGFPWKMIALSYTAPVTVGKISGPKFKFVGMDGCEFTLTGPNGDPGEMDFKYNNSTGRLAFYDGSYNNLRIWQRNDLCDPLLILLGDVYKFDGTYQVAGVSANWPQVVKLP